MTKVEKISIFSEEKKQENFVLFRKTKMNSQIHFFVSFFLLTNPNCEGEKVRESSIHTAPRDQNFNNILYFE